MILTKFSVRGKQNSAVINDHWDDGNPGMSRSGEDKALFAQISACMKAFTGKNDSHTVNEEIQTVQGEIDKIREEIRKSNLDEEVGSWIHDWEEKKEDTTAEPREREIRSFISESFDFSERRRFASAGPGRFSKRADRWLVAAITSVAAASVFLGVLLLKPFSASDSLAGIYSTYYEPFNIASTVTRGEGGPDENYLSGAVESYKAGDFRDAAMLFSEALNKIPGSASARFFLGISELGAGNTVKSIEVLRNVAEQNGNFASEANWYLGLAYLRNGNGLEAAGCFRNLVKNEGFYSRRAAEILRRLR